MPAQVADAVAVGVGEAADEHLVEDRALVPLRVVAGRTAPVSESLVAAAAARAVAARSAAAGAAAATAVGVRRGREWRAGRSVVGGKLHAVSLIYRRTTKTCAGSTVRVELGRS